LHNIDLSFVNVVGDRIMDLQKFTKMLEAFPRTNTQSEISQTFLEIAGYPHLENIASNILEFFFDTQEEHQFETLFLESLLETAGQTFNPADLDVDSTEREAFTQANTRLDLVISTPTLLIGIENKLFHQVNNDFKIYGKHLHEQAKERKVICILLSLYPVARTAALNDFIPITYVEFFDNIRKNMGRFVVEANQRYVPLLFDFMQTVEHLQQEKTMADQEFRTWIVNHHDEIKNLLQEIRQYKRYLRDQVKILQTRIDVAKHKNSGLKITAWLYEPTNLSVSRLLVYDFVTSEKLEFAIEVVIHPDNWEVNIVSRESTTLESVEVFLNQDSSIKIEERLWSNRVRVGDKFEYDADKTVIAAYVQSLIDYVVKLNQKATENFRED
jgi:hypothetical protein